MNQPKVSIIIPAYNQAQYLADAVQSVLDQTFTDFELIIVDDGSTDNTPQVIAGFQDSRVRSIRQENKGLSGARNTGIKLSTAPFLTFLDSDDRFLPNHLNLLYTYLKNHSECGMVSGGRQMIDINNKVLQEQVDRPQWRIEDLLINNPFLNVGCVLIRRMWLDSVDNFDESLRACEDWDLWLKLASAGCQFAWIEEPVMAYRIHQNQMTREIERMRKSRLAVLDKFFSRPDLPKAVMKHQDRAIASVHIKVAALAYRLEEFETGQAELIQALRLDPSLQKNGYEKLVSKLMGWAYSAQVTNPTAFLKAILSNIPSELPGLRTAMRKAVAATLIKPLFDNPDNWAEHKKLLVKAIWYDPSWLRNKGVLRMLTTVWLPISRGA